MSNLFLRTSLLILQRHILSKKEILTASLLRERVLKHFSSRPIPYKVPFLKVRQFIFRAGHREEIIAL